MRPEGAGTQKFTPTCWREQSYRKYTGKLRRTRRLDVVLTTRLFRVMVRQMPAAVGKAA